jgi:hypothetical protein
MLVRTKTQCPGDVSSLVKGHQCHQPTHSNQQFLSWVTRVPVWAYVGTGLHGIEQALARILIALVDITVLALSLVYHRQASQFNQIL